MYPSDLWLDKHIALDPLDYASKKNSKCKGILLVIRIKKCEFHAPHRLIDGFEDFYSKTQYKNTIGRRYIRKPNPKTNSVKPEEFVIVSIFLFKLNVSYER